MKSQEYLSLARYLVDAVANAAPLIGNTAAPECRCAISRAYYAVFNRAVDCLDLIGFEATNSGAVHAAVQHAFNQASNRSLNRASANLNTLYAERRKADYEMNDTRSESTPQALAMVQLAESSMHLIETVIGDTALWGQIITDILKYINQSSTGGLRRKAAGARRK
jgi:uncharacterized protein (UPF0332 family)